MAVRFPAEDVNWRDVDSSNVLAVGWDRERRMYVRFKGNSVYLYTGVSRQRAVAMIRAASIGKYLNQKIKPNYPAVRVA